MIGEKIRTLRETNNMLIRELAAQLEMDTAMLSKMERGERPFKKEDIMLLAKIFKQAEKDLLTLWLADRILKTIADEEDTIESLELALNIAKNNLKK
ncbi:MAG TPA: helix-turn-helix transcriptional regulator [Xanthomarina sp.]|nr:helix-turn-helix transcriptional regulator [Xanthomarina sp.]